MTVDRFGDGTVVVRVAGELDLFTAPRCERAVLSALDPAVRTVLLDLQRVSFLGVSGLAALLSIDATTRRIGASLRLMTPPRPVGRPLDLVGLTSRSDPYDPARRPAGGAR